MLDAPKLSVTALGIQKPQAFAIARAGPGNSDVYAANIADDFQEAGRALMWHRGRIPQDVVKRLSGFGPLSVVSNSSLPLCLVHHHCLAEALRKPFHWRKPRLFKRLRKKRPPRSVLSILREGAETGQVLAGARRRI